MQPPTGGGDGEGGGGPEAGWEVSNEEGPPSSGNDGGVGESDTANEEGDSQVDALARALGELDGEILEERSGPVGNVATSSGQSPANPSAEGAPVPSPPMAEPQIAQAPTPIPPDRPDARDDDVVARQLREAAMAETDPDLREDLWEEYRRYKAGL